MVFGVNGVGVIRSRGEIVKSHLVFFFCFQLSLGLSFGFTLLFELYSGVSVSVGVPGDGSLFSFDFFGGDVGDFW